MNTPTHASARLAAAFWLLAAAWLCANIRPGTLSAMFEWLADSRHFSHQERLAADVAALLGGEKPVASVAESEASHEPAPPLPVVPENAFKKLEAPLGRSVQVAAASCRRVDFLTENLRTGGEGRAAQPHGPPRPSGVG